MQDFARSAYADGNRTGGSKTAIVRVEEDNVFETGRGLYLLVSDSSDTASAWLPEADARELAAALADRYGVAPLADLKNGDEVALAPATRSSMRTVDMLGATRFRVSESKPDDDGDISVVTIDGPNPGRSLYVLPSYVRSTSAILPRPEVLAAPAKAALSAGDPVFLTAPHAGLTAGTSGLVRGTTFTGVRLLVMLPGGMTANRVVPETKLALLVKAEEPAAAPSEPRVGDVFELARPFRMAGGDESFLSRNGTTRVRIDALPDSDGDYHVVAMNGEEAGEFGYIDRAHFEGRAPVVDRPWAVGDEAIVTGTRGDLGGLRVGDRVKLTNSCPVGTDTFDVDLLSRIAARSGFCLRTVDMRRP